MDPYSPREIHFHGLRNPNGWTLKLYSVQYGNAPVDWAGFEQGLQLIERELPAPDESRGRPGLGFAIAHQGKTGDYVVLCWWDNENELPLRVWIRRSREDAWRPAKGDESFCVWDLEIIWAERGAWVTKMLAPDGPDPEAYLAEVPPHFQAASDPA